LHGNNQPVNAASFILGVLVLPIAFFAFRSVVIGLLRLVGLENVMSSQPSTRDQLWGIRTQFSILEEELFEKANRVQLDATSHPDKSCVFQHNLS